MGKIFFRIREIKWILCILLLFFSAGPVYSQNGQPSHNAKQLVENIKKTLQDYEFSKKEQDTLRRIEDKIKQQELEVASRYLYSVMKYYSYHRNRPDKGLAVFTAYFPSLATKIPVRNEIKLYIELARNYDYLEDITNACLLYTSPSPRD